MESRVVGANLNTHYSEVLGPLSTLSMLPWSPRCSRKLQIPRRQRCRPVFDSTTAVNSELLVKCLRFTGNSIKLNCQVTVVFRILEKNYKSRFQLHLFSTILLPLIFFVFSFFTFLTPVSWQHLQWSYYNTRYYSQMS